MPTAEELLAASVDSESESNELIINLETRVITIPTSISNLGVESDDDVKTLHFKMDRHYDGLDLMNFDIRINYLNAKGGGDIYEVKNPTISDDTIQFDWLVGRYALTYKGSVKFNVCMRLLDSDGTTAIREFNTAIASISVIEGLEVSDVMVEEYGNLLVEWEARLFGAADSIESDIKDICETYKAEIEAKGESTLTTIPDDYTTVSNTASQALRTRATVIVEAAEGTAISVSDASDDCLRGLRIFGKSTQDGTPTPDAPVEIVSIENPQVYIYGRNLAKLDEMAQHSNTSLNISDDGYTIVAVGGTSSSYTSSSTYLDHAALAGKTVILKADSIYETDINAKSRAQIIIDADSGMQYKHINSTTLTITFSVPEDVTKVTLAVYTNNTGTALASDNTITIEGLGVYLADSDWEKCKETQIIPTSYTLPGIPVATGGSYTDENGQQWICDEVDFERGVHVQRILKKTFDGSEAYQEAGTQISGTFTAFVVLTNIWIDPANAYMSDTYVGYSSENYKTSSEEGVYSNTGFNNCNLVIFRLSNDHATDLASLVEWMSTHPATVYCPLATPIETALTEAELLAFANACSNYPNTVVLNDAGAYMEVSYNADTKTFITNKIAEAIANL